MNPADLLRPRVFICKAGRFLDTMSYQMGGEGSVKSREESEFGSNQFEESCDPADLSTTAAPTENIDKEISEEGEVTSELVSSPSIHVVGEEVSNNFDDADHTVAVLDVRNGSNEADFKLPPGGEFKLPPGKIDPSFHDLPILVLEGLPKPKVDQTEEDVVTSLLKEMVTGLPENSVRTAIRLPLTQQTNGKSIVLVELDTEEHENLILNQRNALRGGVGIRSSAAENNQETKHGKNHPYTTPGNQNLQRNDKFLLQRWKNLGVRRAKFKELWKFVEELSVVKRVTGISTTTPSKTENNNPNKVENNKFLFGTAAATSLNVKDSEKESKNALSASDLPPQVVVRNKKPINITEGSGYEDVESNGVS